MDNDICICCAPQFSKKALEAVNRDELLSLDSAEASEHDLTSLHLMAKTRCLALSQGISFRFVVHGSIAS